jgi:hypothetical protein
LYQPDLLFLGQNGGNDTELEQFRKFKSRVGSLMQAELEELIAGRIVFAPFRAKQFIESMLTLMGREF